MVRHLSLDGRVYIASILFFIIRSLISDDFATAKSKDVNQVKAYDIVVALNKPELGKCKVVVLTAVTSRSEAISRITESYTSSMGSGSFSYNFYKAKNSGAIFVPQTACIYEIPEDVQKVKLRYTTPSTTFHEEKWEYIGDTSNGFKINGVAVYLIMTDEQSVKILRTFSSSSTKDPITASGKKVKSEDDLPKWCIESRKFEVVDEDLDWNTCSLEVVEDK